MSSRKRRIAKSAPRSAAGARGGRGTIWLYGRHAVSAALLNPGRRCLRLVATEAALAELRRRDRGLDRPGLAVEAGAREAVARLLPPGAVHQGAALAVTPLSPRALDEVCAPPSTAGARRTALVLDRVTDPRNVGAALRAAAAFDALAVIVPDRHAPGESGALAKAASGALEAVPLVRVANLARALATLKRHGFWCVGLDAAAPETLAAADPGGDVALVLGAEGAGLRRLTRERCDALARLAISVAVESLNVAAAAAVALYALADRR